jgi:hypothetical protein
MKDIRVVSEGKLFKVMVNYIQRAIFQSPQIANERAKEIHQKELPYYNLTLYVIQG